MRKERNKFTHVSADLTCRSNSSIVLEKQQLPLFHENHNCSLNCTELPWKEMNEYVKSQKSRIKKYEFNSLSDEKTISIDETVDVKYI